jgi:hypothetical protein
MTRRRQERRHPPLLPRKGMERTDWEGDAEVDMKLIVFKIHFHCGHYKAQYILGGELLLYVPCCFCIFL